MGGGEGASQPQQRAKACSMCRLAPWFMFMFAVMRACALRRRKDAPLVWRPE